MLICFLSYHVTYNVFWSALIYIMVPLTFTFTAITCSGNSPFDPRIPDFSQQLTMILPYCCCCCFGWISTSLVVLYPLKCHFCIWLLPFILVTCYRNLNTNNLRYKSLFVVSSCIIIMFISGRHHQHLDIHPAVYMQTDICHLRPKWSWHSGLKVNLALVYFSFNFVSEMCILSTQLLSEFWSS